MSVFQGLRGWRLWSLGLLGAWLGMCMPQARAEALPSAVASRVRQINTTLNAIEQALDREQLTTAQRRLVEVQRTHKEIQDRYAATFDPKHPDFATMHERLQAVTARVEAAGQAAEQAKAVGDEAKAANEALCREWLVRIKPFLTRGEAHYLPSAIELGAMPPEERQQHRAALDRARTLVAEFDKVDFPTGKTQALVYEENSLKRAIASLEEGFQDDAQSATCQEWVDLLAPYVEVGMQSPKLLITSAAANAQLIEERQALYEEAQAAFTLYRDAKFPHGKTQRLERIETMMAASLEAVPKALAESRALVAGSVEMRMDHVLQHFEEDTKWKSDVRAKPPILMARDLEPLRQGVAEYARNAGPGDAKLAELRGKLKRIEAKDAEHRIVWAQRTFQQPNAYAGPDLEALKQEAQRAAAKAHPKARVLHVTVPSRDWSVENVVEFTDTTKTAVRRRITRSVRAQVAVRGEDGKVWLLGIYLGQDRQPDGKWAPLQGHSTWTDPMVPDNIGTFVAE